MPDIGVIGPRDAVIGFKAVGIAVYPAETGLEASRLINRLGRENYSVLFVTEELYLAASEAVKSFKDDPFPAIIPIPGSQGSLGIGLEGVRDNIRKAVGADLLFGEGR